MASKWTQHWTRPQWTNTEDSLLVSQAITELSLALDEKLCFIGGVHKFTSTNTPFTGYAQDNSWMPAYESFYPIRSISFSLEALFGDKSNDFVTYMDLDNLVGQINPSLPLMSYTALATEYLYTESTADLLINRGTTGEAVLITKEEIKQIYEYLQYKFYVGFNFFKNPSPFEEVENKTSNMSLSYLYYSSNSPVSANTFLSVTFNNPLGAGYTTNDLNESFPFSTQADIMAYMKSKFDSINWSSGGGTFDSGVIEFENTLDYNNPEVEDPNAWTVNNIFTFKFSQTRFKLKQAFRPTQPERYDYNSNPVLYNFSKKSNANHPYYNFISGATVSEGEFRKHTLVADVDGWFYLYPQIDDLIDFSTLPVHTYTDDGTEQTYTYKYSQVESHDDVASVYREFVFLSGDRADDSGLLYHNL